MDQIERIALQILPGVIAANASDNNIDMAFSYAKDFLEHCQKRQEFDVGTQSKEAIEEMENWERPGVEAEYYYCNGCHQKIDPENMNHTKNMNNWLCDMCLKEHLKGLRIHP